MQYKIKLLIILLTIGLYSTVINFSFFTWDDISLALDNRFKSIDTSSFFDLITSPHYGLYHPITTLSFLLDFYIGSGKANIFHITNLILHLINITLVFKIIQLLFHQTKLAIIVTVLFAIHTCNVETVVWISSRKDLLYSLFYFLSIIFYVKYINRKQSKHYIITLLFFIFAILSKVQATQLFLVFFLIDFVQEKIVTYKNLLLKIPFAVISILFLIINYNIQTQGIIKSSINYSLLEKFIYSGYSIFTYIVHIIYPDNLSVFYPYPTINIIVIISSILTYGIITIILIISYKRRMKLIFFGCSFFILNLLLVLNFYSIGESIVNDRYLYVSSIGIFIIFGYLIESLFKNSNKLYIFGTFFIVIALFIISYQRVFLWGNNISLFKSDYKKHPTSEILGNSLASELINKKDYDTSLSVLNKIITSHPNYWGATYNRGIIYYKTGNYNLAINDFITTLKINSYYKNAFLYLAKSYEQQMNYKLASINFISYLNYNQNPDLSVLKSAAFCHSKINQYDIAIKLYQEALVLAPDDAFLYYNIADANANIGKFNDALIYLDKALFYKPNMLEALHFKGILKFKINENGCKELELAAQNGYELSKKALIFYCK